MTTKIFVNLPVKNLDRSIGFFKGLGFTNWACGTAANRSRRAPAPAGVPVDQSAAEEQRQASPGLDGEP